jgi:small-conductance mechanosensitive channel
MNELWDIIISGINKLEKLPSAVETGSENDDNIKNLLEQIQNLKENIIEEKAALEKKLKVAEKKRLQLWELLDSKNAETEVLDQRLAQAEKEQLRLSELLSRIPEELKQENELLLMQLQEVQKELEARSLEQHQQPTGKKVTTLNTGKSTQQLTDEINALQQTLSWRVTAPLRWVRAVMLGRKYKKQYVFAGKSNKQLSDDIAAMRQSWSWRITFPLRRLFSVIK